MDTFNAFDTVLLHTPEICASTYHPD